MFVRIAGAKRSNSNYYDIIIQDRKDFIARNTSGYAAENERDFFAEYLTSKNPRQAAKIFGDIIDKALGH